MTTVISAAGDGTVKPTVTAKHQRKAERRVARKRKAASRSETFRHADVRAAPHPEPVRPSEVLAIRAPHRRGPGEELAYDYADDDHGWFVVPRAGEPFELPLTDELEWDWDLLAERIRACAPIAKRIGALRAAGRTHVQATLESVFWHALLPDGSTVLLESASDDEPTFASCPELAGDGPVGFLASELGFERFDGEVALQAYAWMAGEKQAPVAVARRVGERWTEAYRVRLYDGSGDEHARIPPELCPLRGRSG
jgi:hypothetical protein